MTPSRLATLALPLIVGLSACALPQAPGANAPLVGTEWRLVSLGGAAVLDAAPATLAFPEAGRVAGQGSCNRFFGSYTLVDDRIAFGQMGMTRMACAGAVGEQENRYMAALQKAQRVQVDGARLTLSVDGMAQPLRYVRTKP
jgi:heat shock protein HslJ